MNDNAKKLLRSARDSAVNTHVREDIDEALARLEDFESGLQHRVCSAIIVCETLGKTDRANRDPIVGAVLASLKDPND